MSQFLAGVAVALAFGLPTPPGLAQTQPPAAASATKLPSGWTMHLEDREVDPSTLNVEAEHGGLRVPPGPAALFDRGTTASRRFVATARFTARRPTGPPTPSGGYGIFIGGADLDTASPRYTAFLIRQDGEYAIVRHVNGEMRYVVEWTKHAALPGSAPLPPSFRGRPRTPQPPPGERGELRRGTEGGSGIGVVMQVDAGEQDVRLLVNDAEIASVATSDVDTDGIVGVRVRAETEVTFSNFDISGTKR